MTLDWKNVLDSMRKKLELKQNKVDVIEKENKSEDIKKYPSVAALKEYTSNKLDGKQDKLISSDGTQNFRLLNDMSLLGTGNVNVLTKHQSLDNYYRKSEFDNKFKNIIKNFQNKYNIIIDDYSGHTNVNWKNEGYDITQSTDNITVLTPTEEICLFYLTEYVDVKKVWEISFNYFYVKEVPVDISKQSIRFSGGVYFTIQELFEKASSSIKSCRFTLSGKPTNYESSEVYIQIDNGEKTKLCDLRDDFTFTFNSSDTTAGYLMFNGFTWKYLIPEFFMFTNYKSLPEEGDAGVTYLYDGGQASQGVWDIFIWLKDEKRYTQIGKTNYNIPFLVLKEDLEIPNLLDKSGHSSCWTKNEIVVDGSDEDSLTYLTVKNNKKGNYKNAFKLHGKDTWDLKFKYYHNINNDLNKLSVMFAGNEYSFAKVLEGVELKDGGEYEIQFFKHITLPERIITTVNGKNQHEFDFVEFEEYLFSLTVDGTEQILTFSDLNIKFRELFPNHPKKQDLLIDSGEIGKNIKKLLIGDKKYGLLRTQEDLDDEIRINVKKTIFNWLENNPNEKSYILNAPDTFILAEDLVNDSDYILLDYLEDNYYKKIGMDDQIDKRIFELGIFKVLVENELIACMDNSLTLLKGDNYYDLFFAIGKDNMTPVPLGSTRDKSLLTEISYASAKCSDKYIRKNKEKSSVLVETDYTDQCKNILDRVRNTPPYKTSQTHVDFLINLDNAVNINSIVRTYDHTNNYVDKYVSENALKEICEYYTKKMFVEA